MSSNTVRTSAIRIGSDEWSSWAENPLFHISRVCLGFLQGLFSEAPKGCFHWVADREQSEIVITDDLPIDYDVVNKRPAIASVRSATAFGNVAMDNMMETNLKTGSRLCTDLISGHITFNCLSRTKVEADNLGWLVGRHIWIFRHVFLRSGFHEFGLGIQIGAPSPAGLLVSGAGDTEILTVPVTSPFRFQWTERITPLNTTTVGSMEFTMCSRIQALTGITEAAEGPGSTGPGMRGTAIGARYSNQMNSLRSSRGRIRGPSIRGRVIQRAPMPGGQALDTPECKTYKT
jgi:hypothetical protein